LKYLAGLANAIQREGGQIYTQTHVSNIAGGFPVRVETSEGPIVKAHAVVVATNSSFNDVVTIHTKQAAYRTYVMGTRVTRHAIPRALYWDTRDPYHYVRLQPLNQTEDMLIVGGEDHKTGQAEDANERYARLRSWANTRFPISSPAEFQWSGQVMETVDGLAFIGRNPLDSPNVYIATGDSGMGMTHGTIAGMLLTDLILERDNKWAALYDPGRITLRAAKEFTQENVNVAAQYVEWITPGKVGSAEEVIPGSGAVIRRGLTKLAVYRDEQGRLHERSAVCPHLKCIVNWNAAEQTWDCPCHGSRFSKFGAVIHGPAITDLDEAPKVSFPRSVSIANSLASGMSELNSTMVTESERLIIASVDRYLAAGRELKQWWKRAHASDSFADRFNLGLTFNNPDTSFGFFDTASINGQQMPVMGNFQTMLFDCAKLPGMQGEAAARYLQQQIREFVLHYFMRVSDFRQPQGTTEKKGPIPPPYLRPLSMCTQEDPRRIGFGFSQLFYKLQGTGEIGRFPDDKKAAIVDLRQIGCKYEWIVVKVRIFDFSFVYQPFGPDGSQLVLPLSESSYLILSQDFIVDENNPLPGVLGRYGLGYAFIKEPNEGLLAYGPGQFDAAIELFDFLVLDDGKTRVDMTFVANRPDRILNVSLDPVNWGFALADLGTFGMASRVFAPLREILEQMPFRRIEVDPVYSFIWLANVMTSGQAAAQLCISREEMDRQFLVKHFMQHYETMVGALRTWRQVPDWLAGEVHLPRWVVTGVSS
jgi:Rieske Fe-S protein